MHLFIEYIEIHPDENLEESKQRGERLAKNRWRQREGDVSNVRHSAIRIWEVSLLLLLPRVDSLSGRERHRRRMRIGFQSDDALLCRETMARCQEIVGWLRTGNVASSYSRCVMEYNRNMASEKYDDTRRSHFRRERGRERFVKRFFSWSKK